MKHATFTDVRNHATTHFDLDESGESVHEAEYAIERDGPRIDRKSGRASKDLL